MKVRSRCRRFGCNLMLFWQTLDGYVYPLLLFLGFLVWCGVEWSVGADKGEEFPRSCTPR